MDRIRNIVIIGAEDTGKTTLANALLGKDIFPQSYEYVAVPTRSCASEMLTDTIRLADTPGYSLLWGTVPADVTKAVSEADTLVVMLSGELAEDVVIPSVDSEWDGRRDKEAKLLEALLEGKTRDIYFVIPYCAEDWPEEQVPLKQALRLAKACFSRFSDHADAGFFCIDHMQALEGELWADDAMITASGILPLKAALLGTEE